MWCAEGKVFEPDVGLVGRKKKVGMFVFLWVKLVSMVYGGISCFIMRGTVEEIETGYIYNFDK